MRLNSVLAAAGAGLLAATASADVHVFSFQLDGLQEVAPVATTGSGIATVTLDDATGQVLVIGTYENLIGNTTMAHLHGLAPAGMNAGVIFGLTINIAATSGNFSGAGVLNAAQIQGMLDGNTYINVHTSFSPSGEIRGQVVPAPASLGALGLGLLAAGRRRRG